MQLFCQLREQNQYFKERTNDFLKMKITIYVTECGSSWINILHRTLLLMGPVHNIVYFLIILGVFEGKIKCKSYEQF